MLVAAARGPKIARVGALWIVFAVAPHVRRAGIGSMMCTKLIAKLQSHRRSKISLAIRESNLAAQLFFREHGFRACKVMKSYYEDSGEDAFLMEFLAEEEVEEDDVVLVNRIAKFA